MPDPTIRGSRHKAAPRACARYRADRLSPHPPARVYSCQNTALRGLSLLLRLGRSVKRRGGIICKLQGREGVKEALRVLQCPKVNRRDIPRHAPRRVIREAAQPEFLDKPSMGVNPRARKATARHHDTDADRPRPVINGFLWRASAAHGLALALNPNSWKYPLTGWNQINAYQLELSKW